MSTPAVVRVTTGVPNGGQFAPSAQGESTVVLEGAADTDVKLQPWGDKLDAQIDVAVCDWAAQLEEGSSTADITELLDTDEDALVAAYGEERSDFLCALRFEAETQEYRTWRGGEDGPAEYGSSGRLHVYYHPWGARHGKQLTSSDFSFEDEPEVRGLISHYPVNLDV